MVAAPTTDRLAREILIAGSPVESQVCRKTKKAARLASGGPKTTALVALLLLRCGAGCRPRGTLLLSHFFRLLPQLVGFLQELLLFFRVLRDVRLGTEEEVLVGQRLEVIALQ